MARPRTTPPAAVSPDDRLADREQEAARVREQREAEEKAAERREREADRAT